MAKARLMDKHGALHLSLLPWTLLQVYTRGALTLIMHLFRSTKSTRNIFEAFMIVSSRLIFRQPLDWRMLARLSSLFKKLFLDMETCRVVQDGFAAYWVNLKYNAVIPTRSRTALILVCHAGAFFQCDGAVWMLTYRHMLKALAKRGIQARLLVLEWPLIPEHIYPAQVNTVVAAYNWLTAIQKQDEKLILFGDSSGGNLILSSLVALKEDHPHVRPPDLAVLVSPWVDLSFDSLVYDEHCQAGLSEEDYLPPDLFLKGGVLYTGYHLDLLKHPRVSPIFIEDFRGLVGEGILLIQGEAEVLAPDITRFARKMEKGLREQQPEVEVQLHSEPDMVHNYAMVFPWRLGPAIDFLDRHI